MKRLLTFVTAIILFAVSGMSQNNCDLINSATFNVPAGTQTLQGFSIACVNNANPPNNSGTNVNVSLPIGQWSYIALTKSSTNECNLYLNGQNIFNGNYANIAYSWTKLILGSQLFGGTYSNFFNGAIDEVRISNNVRSATEILNYFNSNLPFSVDANTIGLWSFDQNSGTTVAGTVGGNGITNAIWVDGKFSKALQYNGTTSYTDIVFTTPTTNSTIELWIKPNNIALSWPVMTYGFNSSGLLLNPYTTNINYTWSTGATGNTVTVDPRQIPYISASNGQCSDTIWFNSQSACNTLLPSYISQNGLIGWWPFNGNANDESGNGNNGTVNGATLTTDRFGNANKAYSFDGVNDYIEVPDNSSLDINGNITISAWINPASLGSYRIVDKATVNFGGAYGFDLSASQLTPNTIDRLRYLNGDEQSKPFGLSTNKYFHILITYNQINLKYYINGVLNNTISKTGLANNNNNPLRFAANSLLNDNWFHGVIDDIAIWNRALTEQEIKNLYNGNICYQNVTVTDTLLINTAITGFNPITYQNTIKVYPNPSKDQITVDFGNFNTLNGYQLKITNSIGQQMYQTAINRQSVNISLGSWTGKGLYYIQIFDNNGINIETRKILIQ